VGENTKNDPQDFKMHHLRSIFWFNKGRKGS